MRKHFFVSVLSIIVSSSFSFYRFQGPYVIDGLPNENSINNSYSLNKESLEKEDIPFLYEPNTSLSIGLEGPLETEVKQYNYEVLRGNFDYNNEFWKINEKNSRESYNKNYNYFISFIYQLPVDSDGTFSKENIESFKKSLSLHLKIKWSKEYVNWLPEKEKKIQWSKTFDNFSYAGNSIQYFYPTEKQSNLSKKNKDLLNDALEDYQYKTDMLSTDSINMYVREACEKYSNIYIKNRVDRVRLSENNKSVDLQEALISYYESDINTQLTHALKSENLGGPSSSTVARIPTLNHPQLNEKSLKLLKECKILALWYVIPEEMESTNKKGELKKKIVRFKLFGLAEDKDKKKFHWVTDLNNNISVLLQYAKSN